MSKDREDIRIALPSKGRLAEGAMQFLAQAGLKVDKPNPRQFEAQMPSMPGLNVLFQRAGDIPYSVRDGSVDFGITGWDALQEKVGKDAEVLPLIEALGFGDCRLMVIVPEELTQTTSMQELRSLQNTLGRSLRVATKYPALSSAYFDEFGLQDIVWIEAEGTLEAAPAIGYADLIVDLVSTGTTLRDNRLRPLDDGLILDSQACLIANRTRLKASSQVLEIGRLLVEFIEAHLRAIKNVSIFANMRGDSPQGIAERMLGQRVIGGLEGPTISPVVTQKNGHWYAVHIIVRKDQLPEAIDELRAVGGSGVVVTPVTYIFEEQPEAYRVMLKAIGKDR
ncbi:MAG: ATP phosphoribosyltransferase [Anaerolineales bacterium]|jgi:ATP phosphoribosyltransferase